MLGCDDVTTTNTVARLTDVTKHFGSRAVLTGCTIDLRRGECTGLVGPNGAGKSTLIKLIAGLVSPTSGRVEYPELLSGVSAPRCGLLMEGAPFIDSLSGLANLKALARIGGTATGNRPAELMRYVGLDSQDRKPVRRYSMGMRQRLGIAQALLEDNDLLLLDEPTNGLDPKGVIDLRAIISDQVSKGNSLLVSSHNLAEVAAVCTSVYLILNGETHLLTAQVASQQEVEELYLRAVSRKSDIHHA